jgi:hypothetical protein
MNDSVLLILLRSFNLVRGIDLLKPLILRKSKSLYEIVH